MVQGERVSDGAINRSRGGSSEGVSDGVINRSRDGSR